MIEFIFELVICLAFILFIGLSLILTLVIAYFKVPEPEPKSTKQKHYLDQQKEVK